MRTKRKPASLPTSMFFGNCLARAVDLPQPDGSTLREKYVIGDPQDCPAGTSSEMKRRGYVGLYRPAVGLVFRLPNGHATIRVLG